MIHLFLCVCALGGCMPRGVCVYVCSSENTLEELLWYSLSVPGIELRLGDLVTGAFCCWTVSQLASTLLWVLSLCCDSSSSSSLICLCYSLPCIFKRIPQSYLLFPSSLWLQVLLLFGFQCLTVFPSHSPQTSLGMLFLWLDEDPFALPNGNLKQKRNSSGQVSNSELLCHRHMDQTCKPGGFCL